MFRIKEDDSVGRLSGKVIEAKLAPQQDRLSGIGSELQKLRTLSGLTQDEVAYRLGVQQADVSKIETDYDVYHADGQRPSPTGDYSAVRR